MRNEDLQQQHLYDFAASKGYKVLSINGDSGYVVVKLKSGSISNVRFEEVAAYHNRIAAQEAAKQNNPNLHQASTSEMRDIVNQNVEARLNEWGIPNDVKSIRDVSELQMQQLQRMGVTPTDLENKLTSRNKENHLQMQESRFQQSLEAKGNLGQF